MKLVAASTGKRIMALTGRRVAAEEEGFRAASLPDSISGVGRGGGHEAALRGVPKLRRSLPPGYQPPGFPASCPRFETFLRGRRITYVRIGGTVHGQRLAGHLPGPNFPGAFSAALAAQGVCAARHQAGLVLSYVECRSTPRGEREFLHLLKDAMMVGYLWSCRQTGEQKWVLVKAVSSKQNRASVMGRWGTLRLLACLIAEDLPRVKLCTSHLAIQACRGVCAITQVRAFVVRGWVGGTLATNLRLLWISWKNVGSVGVEVCSQQSKRNNISFKKINSPVDLKGLAGAAHLLLR